MTLKPSRKITFEELGDMLQAEWEAGRLGQEIHDYLSTGLLPVKAIRQQIGWLIQRDDDGDGLCLTYENC